MKAELIASIIAAHCSGDEMSFKTAVEALAADEDKKGNSRVSSMILDAYKGKNITLMKKPDVGQPAGGSFAAQSAGGGGSFAPRDKDSLLELSTPTYRFPMSYCRRISENSSFRFWRNAKTIPSWQSTISLPQTVCSSADLRDAERR